MITIIDYGMGNLRSVVKMVERIGVPVCIATCPDDIASAQKLILPGVGHFAKGMEKLKELDFISVLNKKVVEEKTPILGICLGVQLFTSFSEEGNVAGLNWIKAETKRFVLDTHTLKIPHMGWNTITINKSSPLLANIPSEEAFYFVHSYYLSCQEESTILCTSTYGHSFTSAIQKENIYGVQFHPEKSHKVGLQLMKNFVEL